MKGEWCYWKNYFSKEKCEQIIEDSKSFSFESPTIGHSRNYHQNHRNSKVCWLDLNQYEYLYDEVWKVVSKTNEEWFNFHLTGMEQFQFSKYESGEGFYKRHKDVFWLNPTNHHRKLTCVIQLSDPNDYEGGDLVLYDCENYPDKNEFRQQGNLIFFPSFIFHEVTEVTAGERYSLVCWIYGPKWR